MVADNFFRDLLKYAVLAALFFAGLIAGIELTGIANWERSLWVTERKQGTIQKAEFFDQFQHNFVKLEEWPSPEFSEDVTESELRFAAGVTELGDFAKTLQRAMSLFETAEQEEMAHRFATTLEKKQRSFFIRARLFTEHRLNHYLADTGIRVRVPPIRNRTLEIHGPELDTAEKRDQVITRYKEDLNLARFKEIHWEPNFDGKPIEKTHIHGAKDDVFIVVRESGPNFHFNYHY